jgi:hypothetical protein
VTPSGHHFFGDRQKSVVRARHETLNKRFKDWGALRRLYRHSRVSHSKVFHAIANIVQVTIMNGEPLFEVEYHHQPKFVWYQVDIVVNLNFLF